jgi:hypothetical protein
MRHRTLLLGGAVLAAAIALAHPTALAAQSWRTLTAGRQRQSADTLHLRLQYGAGKLTFGAAPEPLLYEMRLRYDANQFRPSHRYDSAAHTLTIGVDSTTARIFSLNPRGLHVSGPEPKHASDLTLGLARGVPLDLSLEVGAADVGIDLSELAVSSLHLETVASDSRLTFGTPNPARLQELTIVTAATDLTVRQLGNAHADLVRVTTRVGDVDLDLSGDWSGELKLDLHVMLAGATVHIPRDVGVEARVSKLLGDFDAAGLTARNGAFYSANWDHATRRLIINGDVTLADINLAWIE